MKFSIITPSFNQLGYLKQAVASIADQVREDGGSGLDIGGIAVHHHVQDACSEDDTREYLAEHIAISQKQAIDNVTFSFASEPDAGMYEAINKGIAFTCSGHQALGIGKECGIGRAADSVPRTEGDGEESFSSRKRLTAISGRTAEDAGEPNNHSLLTNNSDESIIAWLNCDEQYLPGTLQKVASFFKTHSDVDIVFGGMLMVDRKGALLACRKAMPMRRLFLEVSYLYNYSCAMFIRASLWQKLDGFDTAYKNAGDEDLVRRALKSGAKCGVLNDYLATFTYAGKNLSSDPAALVEHERLKGASSRMSRIFKLPINLIRLTEKAIRGGHVQRRPVEYEIYVGDEKKRTKFVCETPCCRWPDQNKPYLLSHRLSK